MQKPHRLRRQAAHTWRRTAKILSSAVGLACLLAALPARAAGAGEYPTHEVWLGFGGGAALEKDIFNVPDDLASEPEMLIGFGYMYNLDAYDAIGFHMYGGTETTADMFLLPAGGSSPVPVSFELDTYNFGVRLRRTFSRGKFSPYAWIGLSSASGVIDSGQTGELWYNGFSAGVGPGVLVAFNRHFSLALEGNATFGSAKWKTRPFANSSGRAFNPGLLGVTANVGFGWGHSR